MALLLLSFTELERTLFERSKLQAFPIALRFFLSLRCFLSRMVGMMHTNLMVCRVDAEFLLMGASSLFAGPDGHCFRDYFDKLARRRCIRCL